MTVQEYADQQGVSSRTVYRWIEEGQVDAKKVGNMWQVVSQDGNLVGQLKLTIKRQDKEIEYLRSQLNKAAEERTRHDTIVLSLSNQLEHHQLMIEDMRNRSVWRRVKIALRFAS